MNVENIYPMKLSSINRSHGESNEIPDVWRTILLVAESTISIRWKTGARDRN
jgi:hypothetical protein